MMWPNELKWTSDTLSQLVVKKICASCTKPMISLCTKINIVRHTVTYNIRIKFELNRMYHLDTRTLLRSIFQNYTLLESGTVIYNILTKFELNRINRLDTRTLLKIWPYKALMLKNLFFCSCKKTISPTLTKINRVFPIIYIPNLSSIEYTV